MRYIKKTITTTIATAYKVDTDTLTVERVGSLEFVGGLGERLAISKARKEFGKDVTVKVYNVEQMYRISVDDFIRYGESVEDTAE